MQLIRDGYELAGLYYLRKSTVMLVIAFPLHVHNRPGHLHLDKLKVLVPNLSIPKKLECEPSQPVRALNSLFLKWKISSNMSTLPWNTTGDPCSGAALTADDRFDTVAFNPAIICNCDFNNGSTCHITRMKAYKLGIVGNIPEELKNFKRLNNLQIRENYLTGPLPSFIGNFTNLEWLSFGINSLSGPIPKELGNLQSLRSLGMGTNNFTGSLPPELGNLTNLEQIYMDSMGVTGEIPSTFGKLQKLKIMLAFDNAFGGQLPDFIGKLTNLQTLRLHGNSFQGPIPLSFSNLTRLVDLRLGNLLNESSSLEFIKNLKNLNTLVLRDCKIIGSIPSDIGEYKNLIHVDLSFNGLTGSLPLAIFNLPLLKDLFLGNNNLSGNLPSQKNNKLVNIDMSYNALSGKLPSWVSENNLNLNLVANNFDLDDSNKLGLNCLQNSFPCFRGSPVYYNFSVNCGGNGIDTSNGIHYDTDVNLSATSYYVSTDKRWAVSSTGMFLDEPNRNYVESNLSARFIGTPDQELYQTARLSPSSLRYYGLALENGNYTVTLQFAETIFPDTPGRLTVGRRTFDIYVQGNLVQKDFDIRKEAGRSYVAVVRNYTTAVTDNHLEVQLLWAGKGTLFVPDPGNYGPSISAISINPSFKPTVSNRLPNTSKGNKKNKALAGGISAAIVSMLIFVAGICLWKFKKRHSHREIEADEELSGLPALPDTFSYIELRNATDDFSPAHKLGEGGFGSVFKGNLSNGNVVAIKELSSSSHQGKRQFVAEVVAISAVKHRNLVKLCGCCYEGERRLLVYEYLENSSLDQALFGKSTLQLDWPSRFKICLGTAKGIAYLHEESSPRIIHRDIKPSNVLLDADLTPKISDFGLAKLFDEKKSHATTMVAGTFGYLAPEYAMRGQLTEKADIFSFGVLVLELLCGRPNKDPSYGAEKLHLLSWAWQLHENGRELDMLDPKLASFSTEEATRVIGVALLCTQANPVERPPMSRVVAMLEGYLEIPEVREKPYYMIGLEFNDSQLDMYSGSGYVFSSDQVSPQPLLVGRD